MESNLQHEDLLIKLRALLNEEKIKLWEPPYETHDDTSNESLKDLATKYAANLAMDSETVLNALKELQVHSLDRSKANMEFNETGLATFRVKFTIPGEKGKIFKIQKKLDEKGSEIINSIADEIKVSTSRVKLIFNGKVVKPSLSLQEQGLKNGIQIMALVMTESPEEVQQEDTMYMEMKQTRDDAMLLSECPEEVADDEEYMKVVYEDIKSCVAKSIYDLDYDECFTWLEDQNGKTVELPAAERRSLLVGLALHEKGRAYAKKKEYPLALVLLLEADRQLSECRSSILQTVDNYAILQLDISWCYLCLASLQGMADAAGRLARAERAINASYGTRQERLMALKGTAANERMLFMRLYLLQGIVAYHQNRRADAKALLEKAELEINALRVDPAAVSSLMELGWSLGAARAGLRAGGGELTRAHNYLADARARRHEHRTRHDAERQKRVLGVCEDGSPVSQQLVRALVEMGHMRRAAAKALRMSNNHAADAVRMLQEQPELLVDSDGSSDEMNSLSGDSKDSLVEVDPKLLEELVAMGYAEEAAKAALLKSWNHIGGAVDFLIAGGGNIASEQDEAGGPSTSAANAAVKKRHKKLKKDHKKRLAREAALRRLTSAIRTDADEYLDTSLAEEEDYLAQYKSLL